MPRIKQDPEPSSPKPAEAPTAKGQKRGQSVHIRSFKDHLGRPVWVLYAPYKSAEFNALRLAIPESRVSQLVLPVSGLPTGVFSIEHDYADVFRAEIKRKFCPDCFAHRSCEWWEKPIYGGGSMPPAGFVARKPNDAKVHSAVDFDAISDNFADLFENFFSRQGVAPAELTKAAADLKISWPATEEQVDAAFKKAALERHPDIPGGSHEGMKAALESRKILLRKINGTPTGSKPTT